MLLNKNTNKHNKILRHNVILMIKFKLTTLLYMKRKMIPIIRNRYFITLNTLKFYLDCKMQIKWINDNEL